MSKNSPLRSRPIFLVGLMGVGKSTIGASLAERLGLTFLDTDEEIERIAGCSIASIFEREGEAGFRERELEAIELASRVAGVVSLGGGAIAQPGVAEKLCTWGRVVYLKAEPEVLIERIGDCSDRPLLAGLDQAARLERLGALYEERRPYYERATHSIDASGSVEGVVDEIVVALGNE